MKLSHLLLAVLLAVIGCSSETTSASERLGSQALAPEEIDAGFDVEVIRPRGESSARSSVNDTQDEDGDTSDDSESPDDTESGDENVLEASDIYNLPDSARSWAESLSEAEAAVRDATLNPDARRVWGKRQQFLYRVLAANPGWAEEALPLVDAATAGAAEANFTARQELSELVRSYTPGNELPAWAINAPRDPEELLEYYHEAAEATDVPWEVLAAINLVETRMGRIDGKSVAGAVGPMQFLPSTWEECCEGDPTIDQDAIRGAAEYLVDRGALTDIRRALRGYNPSEHYVKAISAYASVMSQDPAAYYGYHAWDVYFLTSAGPVLLAEGYDEDEPVSLEDWLDAHPETLVDLVSEPETD